MRIGFIGFGTMGQPMVEHLLKAGHELRVWSRRAASADFAVAGGAVRCDTVHEVAAGSEIVCTNVTASADVAGLGRRPCGPAWRRARSTSTFPPSPPARRARSPRAMLSSAASISSMRRFRAVALARAMPRWRSCGAAARNSRRAWRRFFGAGQERGAHRRGRCRPGGQGLQPDDPGQPDRGLRRGRRAGRMRPASISAWCARPCLAARPARARWRSSAGAWRTRDFAAGVEARLHHKDYALLMDEATRIGAPLPVAAAVWQQLNALMAQGWARRTRPRCCACSRSRRAGDGLRGGRSMAQAPKKAVARTQRDLRERDGRHPVHQTSPADAGQPPVRRDVRL
jgi:2-hydroxy-3-oxopropionate reductase